MSRRALAFLCVAAGLAAAATVLELDGPDVRLVLVVGDEQRDGRTYISELYLKGAGGATSTANLAFNYSSEFMSGQSSARLSSSALSWSEASSSTFCSAAGGVSPPTRELELSCVDPSATMHVVFASFGTPGGGGCDAPRAGACTDATAPQVVGAACEGKNSCSVFQGPPSFPTDPCPDQPKTLFVKAVCSTGAGRSNYPLVSWAGATGGTVLSSTSATSASLAGVMVGPFVSESWTLDATSGMQWRVARTYLSALEVGCDRGPFVVINAQYNLSWPLGSQILSTLDPDFMWDPATGTAFPCALGDAPDASWSFGASPHQEHELLFSPSLLRLASAIGCMDGDGAPASCGLVLAWPTWPGVGGGETTMAFGAVPYAPSGSPGPRTVAAGDELVFEWSWQAAGEASSRGLVPFNFSLPSSTVLEAACARMASSFNMWAGNVFGNSPSSIVCLHEMSFFPLIQGVFGGTGGHVALQSELKMFAAHAVRADGFVYPRWGFDAYDAMPIHDQLPHFLLAFYYHAINTGDKAFIVSVWPALLKVIGYLDEAMLFATTDLANTPPPASGLPNSQAADNWFDIVNFGGRDAIINAMVCQAFNATSQLAEWIGDSANAAALAAKQARCVVAFNALFWNSTLGLYGDWSDTSNRTRFYGYIWQQALASDPLSGITNATRAAAMASAVAARIAEIKVEYGRTDDELWCAPTNLWGVAPADSFYNGTLQDQAEFGHYENGCCFSALNGLYMQLLANGGRREAAFAHLAAMLKQMDISGLWGQHYDWINKGSEGFDGSDVLTGSLVALRTGLHGAMAIRQGLGADALWAVAGAATAAVEGASLSFFHFGHAVTATVVSGTTVFTWQ